MAEGGATYNAAESMLTGNERVIIQPFSGGGQVEQIEEELYIQNGGGLGEIDELLNQPKEVHAFLIATGFGRSKTIGYTFDNESYTAFKDSLVSNNFIDAADDIELYNKLNKLTSSTMNGGGPLTTNIQNALIALFNYVKIKSNSFTNFTFLYNAENTATMAGGAAPMNSTHGNIIINLNHIFKNYDEIIQHLKDQQAIQFANLNPIAFDDINKQKLINIESYKTKINQLLTNNNNDDAFDNVNTFMESLESFDSMLREYAEQKNATNISSTVTLKSIYSEYDSLKKKYNEIIPEIEKDYNTRSTEQEEEEGQEGNSNNNFNSKFSASSAASRTQVSLNNIQLNNFNSTPGITTPSVEGPPTNIPTQQPQIPQLSNNELQFITGFRNYLIDAAQNGKLPKWKDNYKNTTRLASIINTLPEEDPIVAAFNTEKALFDSKSTEIITINEYQKNKAQKYLDISRQNLKVLKMYLSALSNDSRLAKIEIFSEGDFDIFDNVLFGTNKENFSIDSEEIIPKEVFGKYKSKLLTNSEEIKEIVSQYISKLEQYVIPDLEGIVAGRIKKALKATGSAFRKAGQVTVGAVGKAANATRRFTRKVGSKIATGAKTAASGVATGARKTGQSLAAVGEGVGDILRTGMQTMGDAVTKTPDQIRARYNAKQKTPPHISLTDAQFAAAAAGQGANDDPFAAKSQEHRPPTVTGGRRTIRNRNRN